MLFDDIGTEDKKPAVNPAAPPLDWIVFSKKMIMLLLFLFFGKVVRSSGIQ